MISSACRRAIPINMRELEKIKLLVIIPTLECGGSERYVSLLCNNISVERFEVTLAVLDYSHPFYSINAHHVEIVDLGIKRVRNSLFAIKELIAKKRPDIVYSTANHLNLMLATFRWMFPKNICFIARESSIVSINSGRTKYPSLYRQLVKKFYHRFNLVICQSASMQLDLVEQFNFPKERTVVIPNMVEEVEKETQPAHPGTGLQLITVARLSEEKGLERMIRALAGLDLPFQYHIIGEGRERIKLRQLIDQLKLNDRIILEGEKINPFSHRQHADLFLLGSHYEGFPNALVEAGMYGIPAVAYDAPGGIGEIIRDGENGFLVKDGDEEAFRAAIKKTVNINFDRERIAADTRKRYSVQSVLPMIEKVITQECISVKP